MNEVTDSKNRRVLLIDDNVEIHKDVRKVLCPSQHGKAFKGLTSAMLGESDTSVDPSIQYSINSAMQGQDGLEKLVAALEDNQPYAVAIVDMRMPPGWDGVETIEHLWQADPQLQVIVCTAYSDYSWEQTIERLGYTDRFLILKKPFDNVEISQMVCALSEKWNLSRQVEEQTAALVQSNDRFRYEASQRQRGEEALRYHAFHDALTNLPIGRVNAQ